MHTPTVMHRYGDEAITYTISGRLCSLGCAYGL